jgi:uroporphyrinogen decarboxylase
MTSRISRVMNTIRRQDGAFVPKGELILEPAFARDFLEWRSPGHAVGRGSHTDLLIECCRSLKLDLVCLQAGNGGGREAVAPANPADVRRFADQDLFVFWVVNGAFQTAMTQGEMMAFLMKIAATPETVAAELERLSERVTAAMAEGVSAGAHGIILADDIAYQQSTYISPTFVARHLLPVWRRQTAFARELGVPVFFHSDGNLNPVLSYIAAAGFDGLQCMEPSAGMDLSEIKKTHGGNLCLMGNIDPALLSEPDDPEGAGNPHEPLRWAVEGVMAAAAGGGVIFGSCSGLYEGMSPARVDYMYRLASELDPAASSMLP